MSYLYLSFIPFASTVWRFGRLIRRSSDALTNLMNASIPFEVELQREETLRSVSHAIDLPERPGRREATMCDAYK